MNKSNKVQNIFVELINALGHTMPMHELLECAGLIVNAYEDPIKDIAYFSEGRTPLCELPVNQVIEQWPWEILTSDYLAMSEIDGALNDDYFDHVTEDHQLHRLMAA